MDKKVAGVCSGLAAYFGIEDPLWIRVAFAIGLFAGGIAVPLYFILMIAAPVAKTSADRLQMAGEPINIDTIAKKVEEGFNKVTDKIDSWQKSK
jgi:phage shock protein PspC (stress-responsive transcriptional regulator)